MNLFCLLYATLYATWCSGKSVNDENSNVCSSKGELPPPQLILSAASFQEGKRITLLCLHPSESLVTKFFFCKDGHPISAQKATSWASKHEINVSQETTGYYYCGYQQKDEHNQEQTSSLSGAQQFTVPQDATQSTTRVCSGKNDNGADSGHRSSEVPKIFSVSYQRSSLQEESNAPGTHLEETSLKNSSKNTNPENVHYARIVGLSKKKPLPSLQHKETVVYATIPSQHKPTLEI